jgi:flagellar motor switch protein FliG
MVIEDEGPNNMEGFEHATTIQMHREENSQKSKKIKTCIFHFKVIW